MDTPENGRAKSAALTLLASERPRNVGWLQAGGLLFGDWGTSRLYVLEDGRRIVFPMTRVGAGLAIDEKKRRSGASGLTPRAAIASGFPLAAAASSCSISAAAASPPRGWAAADAGPSSAIRGWRRSPPSIM